jgi:hypothetical protein
MLFINFYDIFYIVLFCHENLGFTQLVTINQHFKNTTQRTW